MALTVKATLTFSATKVILTDTSGNYDAVTNTSGYGAPNALFTDYAHYAIIRKKNVNSVADVVMTLDAYNPITDLVFNATRTLDGWYEAKKLNISKWSNLTSYTGGTVATGNVVYDAGVVYYCIVSNSNSTPATNPTKWTVVTDLTTIESNPTLIATTVGRVTVYNADVYWSKQIADQSQKGNCGLCEDDKLTARLNTILRYIQNVLTADQLGSNESGEWNVQRLIKLGAK